MRIKKIVRDPNSKTIGLSHGAFYLYPVFFEDSICWDLVHARLGLVWDSYVWPVISVWEPFA